MAPKKTPTATTAIERGRKIGTRSTSAPVQAPPAPTALATSASLPTVPEGDAAVPKARSRSPSPVTMLGDINMVEDGSTATASPVVATYAEAATPRSGSPIPDLVSTPVKRTPTAAPTYVPSRATSPQRPVSPTPRRDDFPPLPSPSAEPRPRPRPPPPRPRSLSPAFSFTYSRDGSPVVLFGHGDTSYDEEADIARAVALSLGKETDTNTSGASTARRHAEHAPTSSSRSHADAAPASPPHRRADAAPESPPKRQRADSTGRAIPITRDDSPFLQPIPDPAAARAAREREERHVDREREERRAAREREERHAARERHARPAHHTLDGNPPRGAYATPPEGGYRRVYGVTSATLYNNHNDAQMLTWTAVPDPKLIITISGGNGVRTQMQPNLVTFFSNYFNLDVLHLTRLKVGAPALGQRAGPDPKAWLVTGLPDNQIRWLLHVGMVSRDDGLTIYTHHFSPEISGYAATFEGLIIPAEDTDLARAIIGGAISDDPRIASHVRAHRDRFAPEWSADEAFARFCESITVASIDLLAPNGGGSYIAWNVYVEPFTVVEAHFDTFIKLVNSLVITTAFNGQGRARRNPFHCSICPGTDHPTNLCPCPLAPGYRGPTPETIGALLEASRNAISTRDKSIRPKFEKGKMGKGDRKGKGNRDFRNGGNGRDS
ncbi:hypothetical protein C8F04DRAFT_1282807 [Mycena alexandri]|uniref:Uncharacterized protein n=1 Tax=Mycena alexandri TaxID=1745969 RepID=A0AAD6RZD1_9AGAR|nr:hypothetical protein C8F04DRAFT_1282807 [Mycena alexandri]